jgi:hypothetical protein
LSRNSYRARVRAVLRIGNIAILPAALWLLIPMAAALYGTALVRHLWKRGLAANPAAQPLRPKAPTHAWIPEKSWPQFSSVFGLRDEANLFSYHEELHHVLVLTAKVDAVACEAGLVVGTLRASVPASSKSQKNSLPDSGFRRREGFIATWAATRVLKLDKLA